MSNRKTIMNFRTQVTGVLSDPSFGGILTKWGMGGGTVTSAVGWLSRSGAAVFIGVVITVAGFIVNYLYQRRDYSLKKSKELREQKLSELQEKKLIDENRRAEEIHQLTLKRLMEGNISADSK